MKKKVTNIINEMLIKLKEKGIIFHNIWSIEPLIIKDGPNYKVYFIDFTYAVRTKNVEKKIYDKSIDSLKYLFDFSNRNDIQVDNYVITRMLQDKVLDIQF